MSDEEEGRGSAFPWVLWVLTLAAALVGAWLAYQRFSAEAAGREAALKSADQEAAKTKSLTTRVTDAEQKVADLEAKNKELIAKADELSGTLEQKQEEIDRLTATYHALEDKMQAEIKRGDVRLTQEGDRIPVDLVDKVLFDSGKAELSPKGEEVLTRLGAVLAGMSDRQIQVSGHTDDSPISKAELKEKFPTNWELSVARAVNVVRFLAEKAKVPPSRLVAAGYGQYHPIASNATPRGRALNRRIEVLLLPPLAAKAAKLPSPPPAAPAKDGGR